MQQEQDKDKIKVQRLERYLNELNEFDGDILNEFIQERIYYVQKAIQYYKGDKTQIFDPTIIEDIVR